MRSTQQISPEKVYDLFPYQNAPGDNTFFCIVIEDGGAHPYIRTGDAYQYIDDGAFVELLSTIHTGCLRHSDFPYSAREEQFTLKVDPYKLVDRVVSDSRTGQLYREIMWCWGHMACGGSIFVPVSPDEVKKLRKKQ